MQKSVNFNFFKMYQFFHIFQCILIDFSRIFEKIEIYRFFHWLQNKISQRLLVQITSEEVRSKALDLYFMTIIKLQSFLNSLWSLVQLKKFQKFSSFFLNPSSITAEIKGGWGRIRKIEIFENIIHGCSNAHSPMYFRTIVAEISQF